VNTIQDFFKLGMKRTIPPLIDPPANSVAINLGGGNNPFGAKNYQPPEWFAGQPLSEKDGSVGLIHAYHFFEHLDLHLIIKVLQECYRVLRADGVLQIVVPHAMAEGTHQDLSHLTNWTEDSFKNLFQNEYYDRGLLPRFIVHSAYVMGVNWRNMAVFFQLVRGT